MLRQSQFPFTTKHSQFTLLFLLEGVGGSTKIDHEFPFLEMLNLLNGPLIMLRVIDLITRGREGVKKL